MSEVVVYVDEDLEELIPGFMENRKQDIVLINEQLENGNLSEIQRLGHSMKGSGGGYGFHEISTIGKEIEEAAKNGNRSQISKMVTYLSEYLTQVKIVYQEEE